MKPFLFQLSLLVLLITSAQAQSANPAIWCPPGARWSYGYFDMSSSGTVTEWYAGDTVVSGQPAQVVRRRVTATQRMGPSYSFALPKVVTRVVGERVEVLANGQFYTLYDFAARPGQTWLTVPVTPTGTCAQGLVQVVVDSTGQQQVGGRTLRWFRMHLTGTTGTQPGTWSGRVYEMLGSLYYMQPQSLICHGTDPGFMSPFVSFQATSPAFSVTLRNGSVVLGTSTRADAAGFSVFPNPAAGARQLGLQLPAVLAPGARLRLLNGIGQEVRQQQTAPNKSFSVEGLPAGTYTLLLSEPGQRPLARRVTLD